MKEHDRLIHHRQIDLILRFQRFTLRDDLAQIAVSLCLRHRHAGRHTGALCLILGDKALIVLREGKHLLYLLGRVTFPYICFIHMPFLLTIFHRVPLTPDPARNFESPHRLLPFHTAHRAEQADP